MYLKTHFNYKKKIDYSEAKDVRFFHNGGCSYEKMGQTTH